MLAAVRDLPLGFVGKTDILVNQVVTGPPFFYYDERVSWFMTCVRYNLAPEPTGGPAPFNPCGDIVSLGTFAREVDADQREFMAKLATLRHVFQQP